jgi:hypothetical protein
MAGELYGYLAEFSEVDALVSAVERLRAAGWRRMEVYTPYPMEALAGALGKRWSLVPLAALGGGLTGGAAGFLLQVWASEVAYPSVAGAMPATIQSWPAFIPITFELTILGAALAAAAAMFVLNRLPQPYHPVFNVPEFTRASQDRFFILVEARDAHFQARETRLLLLGLGARQVADVPD